MVFNKKKILNQNIREQGLRLMTMQEQKDLKKMLLCIAEDIDKVCKKYDLKLFLVGGSLLGAIRHHGFIPWDDDIDFGLIREDYKRLISVFDKELSGNYYLRCPNSKYPNGNRFMQIYRKNTLLETSEGSTPLQPNCIFVDIFPYDYVPNNRLLRVLKGMYCNLLMLIASSVCSYYFMSKEYTEILGVSLEGKILNIVERVIGFFFSWRRPERWFDLVDKSIQGRKKSDFITSATGRKHYLGEVFPVDTFFPLKRVLFENLMFYSPQNADEYLKHNYGDAYMTPPPVNKRESHFIKNIKI